MANRVKKLPTARNRYYVEEPIILMTVGEFERFVEHATKMGMFEQQPEKDKPALRQRHVLILKDMREKLKGAKAHYHIKS